MTIQVLINQKAVPLAADTPLAEALAQQAFSPPYAVAINTQFVPRSAYAQTLLKSGDRVEVITPVTGG